MKTIILPPLYQTYNYDCGTKALQSILVYYGIIVREDEIIQSTKTSKEGTSIEGIIKTIKKYRLKYDSRQMTIEDLKDYIKKEIPIIIVLQAWKKRKKLTGKKN